MESPDCERHTICGTPNYIAAGQCCTSARNACYSIWGMPKCAVVGGSCTCEIVCSRLVHAAHAVAHLQGHPIYSTVDHIAA